MNLALIRNVLVVGSVCVSLVGCEHSHRQEVRPASKTSEDPTSWSAPALTNKGEATPDSSKGSGDSDSLPGSLSPRGAEIERSLGVR